MQPSDSSSPSLTTLKTQMRYLGSQWKTNITQFMDQQQQEQTTLSCQLNSLNERMKEEAERRDVRNVSAEACMNTMRQHLHTFLIENPSATYAQWIENLHPENTQDPQLLEEMDKEIDLRFYVEESDHRHLWNEHVTDPVRQVQARNRVWKDEHKIQLQQQHDSEPVDLLSGNLHTVANDTRIATTTTTTGTTSTQQVDADLIQF
jgi:predicted transport protein